MHSCNNHIEELTVLLSALSVSQKELRTINITHRALVSGRRYTFI